MSHHWILITFSWLGTASLQYINTGGPGADTILDPLDSSLQYSLPYANYFNVPDAQMDPDMSDGQYGIVHDGEVQRRRRTADDKEQVRDKRWLPNLADIDKTMYIKNNEVATPFLVGFSGNSDENDTALLDQVDKKNFSPWGGKRDKPSFEHMWTWKRSSSVREPSMPKRVRFSPWGGKRSGQMVYKPGSKSSKLIFSATVPELEKIVSNYLPSGERLNLAGLHYIPSVDKRFPLKMMALSAKFDPRSFKEAMPFKTFVESLPKVFKPGQPYYDVNIKKDGKRKVKFSAWGGKRSPPIIGPIWTPAPENVKDSTLDTIILIRNSPDKDEAIKTV
ncbi:uncharacterized protein LOC114249746 [Bombyx mandarina]|uniref:Uncharacterized protein LOC114249746 n=1 Tax=Bombyx mandarina TaxID=7092 RepID=A0A6J2KC48_BOMMA|nr:uncharacterized protein LOC114249746 [Bombyx mandarina]